MAKRLRNIFDHYDQKENHLTHSLLHVLNNNRKLLKAILKASGIKLTSKQINLITQVAPRTDKDRTTTPDGYIYTEDYNLCIGIETKIKKNALKRKQILGHLDQLAGYDTSYLLVLTPDETEPKIISELVKSHNHKNLKFVSWKDLLKRMSDHGPDKGKKPIGKYLFDRSDMPYIGIVSDINEKKNTGEKIYSPYGFEFTDNLINSLRNYYNLELNDYIKERDMIKRRVYLALRGFQGTRGSLKGLTFGIFADSYAVFPLIKFLYEYLGLYPKIVGLRSMGQINYKSIKEYLKQNSLKTVLLDFYNQIDLKRAFDDEDLDIVFGSSLEKNIIRYSDRETSFINISIPGDEKSIITFRPLMGLNGVLTLVEELINSIKIRNFSYKY